MVSGDYSRSTTLKLMYAKDLKAFNFFQKLQVYVLVSVSSDDSAKPLKQKQPQQLRTPADKEGDGNPEWNHEMQLDLSEVPLEDSDHLFIHFDLRHEGLYFGDKTIGEVRVPLKDVIENTNEIVRFVSYEVRSPEGKPNGVLNFSYKVDWRGSNTLPSSSAPTITGYPVVHHQHHSPDIQNPTTSVVRSSSSGVQYPSLDLEGDSQPEETYSPYLPYPPQGDYYPPAPTTYYPPPPPPPLSGPPPPPPMVHGSCYHPPHQQAFSHWRPHAYDYSNHENWRAPVGESWPADFRLRGRGSFWNDRPWFRKKKMVSSVSR